MASNYQFLLPSPLDDYKRYMAMQEMQDKATMRRDAMNEKSMANATDLYLSSIDDNSYKAAQSGMSMRDYMIAQRHQMASDQGLQGLSPETRGRILKKYNEMAAAEAMGMANRGELADSAELTGQLGISPYVNQVNVAKQAGDPVAMYKAIAAQNPHWQTAAKLNADGSITMNGRTLPAAEWMPTYGADLKTGGSKVLETTSEIAQAQREALIERYRQAAAEARKRSPEEAASSAVQVVDEGGDGGSNVPTGGEGGNGEFNIPVGDIQQGRETLSVKPGATPSGAATPAAGGAAPTPTTVAPAQASAAQQYLQQVQSTGRLDAYASTLQGVPKQLIAEALAKKVGANPTPEAYEKGLVEIMQGLRPTTLESGMKVFGVDGTRYVQVTPKASEGMTLGAHNLLYGQTIPVDEFRVADQLMKTIQGKGKLDMPKFQKELQNHLVKLGATDLERSAALRLLDVTIARNKEKLLRTAFNDGALRKIIDPQKFPKSYSWASERILGYAKGSVDAQAILRDLAPLANKKQSELAPSQVSIIEAFDKLARPMLELDTKIASYRHPPDEAGKAFMIDRSGEIGPAPKPQHDPNAQPGPPINL